MTEHTESTMPQASKPTMSHTEASFHEVNAGNRAAAAATQQGANPASVDAVMAATTEPLVVAGYTLKPATQGTIYLLQDVAEEFEKWATGNNMQSSGDISRPGPKEMYELALGALVFADGRRVAGVLLNQGLGPLLKEAENIIWEVPLEQSATLNAHFAAEFARLQQLNGEESDAEGKPQQGVTADHSPLSPPSTK